MIWNILWHSRKCLKPIFLLNKKHFKAHLHFREVKQIHLHQHEDRNHILHYEYPVTDHWSAFIFNIRYIISDESSHIPVLLQSHWNAPILFTIFYCSKPIFISEKRNKDKKNDWGITSLQIYSIRYIYEYCVPKLLPILF